MNSGPAAGQLAGIMLWLTLTIIGLGVILLCLILGGCGPVHPAPSCSPTAPAMGIPCTG